MSEEKVWDILVARHKILSHSSGDLSEMRVVVRYLTVKQLDIIVDSAAEYRRIATYIAAAEEELFERKLLGKKRLALR